MADDDMSNSSDEEYDEERKEDEENEENGVMDEEDVDMEEMDKVEEHITEAKAKVEADPCDYDNTMNLLRLLRLNGDLEELATARKAAFARFPLSKKLWLQWITDAQSTLPRDEMEVLFRKAVSDSPFHEIWTEFALWATGGGVKKAREIFEDAITSLGFRVDVGGQLWLAFIDLEESFLQGSEGEEEEKARKRVASLYARALRVPTADLADIWEKYLLFAGENVDATISASHKAAQIVLAELAVLEEKVMAADNSVESLYEYLEWELNKDDPARIQAFYERILENHPLDETVWIDYTTYLEQDLKIPSLTLPVYERAVRHCPSSCALWQPLLLAEERAGISLEKIELLWNSARMNMRTAEEGRALYRTFIYLLRRRTDSSGEKDYAKIASVFEDGAKVLSEYFGKNWDPQAEYRRNQAFFYFDRLKDVEKGRKVWEDILASGGGRLAERWLEAIRFERFYGETCRARKLFYKAVNSVSDHPQTIFTAFVQFEREEGTLDELSKALEKVNSQAQRRAEIVPAKEKDKEKKEKKGQGKETSGGGKKRPAQQGEGTHSKKAKLETVTTSTRKGKEQENKAVDKDGFAMPSMPGPKVPATAPRSTSSLETPSPSSSASSSTNGHGNSDDKKWTIFVSNLDFKATPEQIKEVVDGITEVRLMYRGMSKLHKGYGFADMESEEAYRVALTKDRVPIGGRPMYIAEVKEKEQRAPSFKFAAGLEKNKLFVRGVHYDATEEQIRELFSQFGAVQDVRIVTHKSGQKKGVAYVDMETDEGAAAACKAVDLVLLERKLNILLSNPPKKSAPGLAGEGGRAPAPGGRIGHSSMINLVPRNVIRKQAEDTESPSASTVTKKNLSNDQFRNLFTKK